MATRFLSSILLLIVAFGLVLSCYAAANITASSNATTAVHSTADNNLTAASNVTPNANSTDVDIDVKAKFLCKYDLFYKTITKVVTIDKNTSSFSSLQAQIASFFPHKPAKVRIYYNAGTFLNNQWMLVRVNSDEDTRNLMAEYQALQNRDPINLYLLPPERFEWLADSIIVIVVLFLTIFVTVFCFCVCERCCT